MSKSFIYSILSPKKPQQHFEKAVYCPYCLDSGYIHVRLEWYQAQDIPFHSPFARIGNDTVAVACEGTSHGNWQCSRITSGANAGSFKDIFGKPIHAHHYGATLKSGNFHPGDKMTLPQYLKETGLSFDQFMGGQSGLYTPIDDIEIPDEEFARLEREYDLVEGVPF